MAQTLERLKKRPEFLRVAAGRRKWATPGVVLQVAVRRHEPDDAVPADGIRVGGVHADGIRVGYTASRKVGGAVARNRARRRLRAAAATVLPQHAASGADYVMIARAGTLKRPFAELVGDLEEALRRLQMWQAAPPGEDPETTSGRRS